MARERAGISHEEKLRQIQEQKSARKKAITDRKVALNKGKSLGQAVMEERAGATALERSDKTNHDLAHEDVLANKGRVTDDIVMKHSDLDVVKHKSKKPVVGSRLASDATMKCNDLNGMSHAAIDNMIENSVTYDTVTHDSHPNNFKPEAVTENSVTYDTVTYDSHSNNFKPEAVIENSVTYDSVLRNTVTDYSDIKNTTADNSDFCNYISKEHIFIDVMSRLSKSDLSANEMRLLFSLIIEINKDWQTGAKLSLVEIADLIKNDTSNTVRLLKSLVSKGFIVKKKSDAEKDRKNTYLVGYDAFSVSI